MARMSTARRREARAFYLFASPWIIGLFLWTLGPMLASLYLSFTNYDLFTSPQWAGLQNYISLFTSDTTFRDSLGNTLYFVAVGLPLSLLISLGLALLLNEPVRGITAFRTLFYVPSLVPAVASSILWISLFDGQYGIINAGLRAVGLPPVNWLLDPNWVKPAIIITMLWSVGGSMIIYLAGLQNIPEHLYDSAKIDGAGALRRFWNVTLPLLTPTILFQLIIGLISYFRLFDAAYVMTSGGPGDSSTTFMFYLFRNAFGSESNQMGYASAQAWILFVIVIICAGLIFRSAARWVFYEGSLNA